jgi:hypothetical protein
MRAEQIHQIHSSLGHDLPKIYDAIQYEQSERENND